jgi:hypothetical protein
MTGPKLFRTKQTLKLGEDDTLVNVMHPFLTMQSKAALVVRPPRQNVNDLKHLKMSVHYVRSFILDLVFQGLDREALKVCKNVLALAHNRLGVSLFRNYDIQLEDSLPSTNVLLKEAPKLTNFLKSSYDKCLEQISEQRKKARPDRRIKRG